MVLSPLALVVALAAPSDFAPPHLLVQDLAFGTSAPDFAALNGHLGLVPWHPVRFTVDAAAAPEPGELAVFTASSGLAAVPLPLGTGALLVEPVGLTPLGVRRLDPGGIATLDLVVPAALPVGLELATQAATFAPTTGELRPTNALTHVTTDLAPVELATFIATGHPLGTTFGTKALVLHDQAAFDAFWAQHELGDFPVLPKPSLDFATQVAVVAFQGPFPTKAVWPSIAALQPAPGGGLVVGLTLEVLHGSCGGIHAGSSPGQVVAVDRVAGASPASAVATIVTLPCP